MATEAPSGETTTVTEETTATRALLDQWWPIAFTSSVKEGGAPMGVQLFGEPLVLYRAASGDVVCAQDRCLHKSCPMSLGTSGPDGTLKCRYHGWTFGEEGKLEDIPSSSDKSTIPDVSLPTYPVMELDDVVWVFPGDPLKMIDAPVPEDTSMRSLNGEKTREDFAVAYQEAILEDTPFEMAVDINVDFTHLKHVHHNTPPGRAPQMEGTLRLFEEELKDRPENDGSFLAEFLGNHGRSGGRIHFVSPATVMTETFFEKPEFKPFPLVLVFRFVPVAPTKTKVLLKIYRDFLHDAPEWVVKDLVMNMPKVIEQDRLIMAGQLLRMRQGSPHTWLPTESDAHLIKFRKWFTQSEQEGAWFDGWNGRKAKRRQACGLVEETGPSYAPPGRAGETDLTDVYATGREIWAGGESAGLASLAAAGPQRIAAIFAELKTKAAKIVAGKEEYEPPQEM